MNTRQWLLDRADSYARDAVELRGWWRDMSVIPAAIADELRTLADSLPLADDGATFPDSTGFPK